MGRGVGIRVVSTWAQGRNEELQNPDHGYMIFKMAGVVAVSVLACCHLLA